MAAIVKKKKEHIYTEIAASAAIIQLFYNSIFVVISIFLKLKIYLKCCLAAILFKKIKKYEQNYWSAILRILRLNGVKTKSLFQ